MSKLREWRNSQGLTIEQAAERVGVSGVSFGRYEKGRIPEPEIMRRIADITAGKVMPNDFVFEPGHSDIPAPATAA